MNYLVEVKKLKKNYSSKEAVKGISFDIKENEVLGLWVLMALEKLLL